MHCLPVGVFTSAMHSQFLDVQKFVYSQLQQVGQMCFSCAASPLRGGQVVVILRMDHAHQAFQIDAVEASHDLRRVSKVGCGTSAMLQAVHIVLWLRTWAACNGLQARVS